MADKDRDDPATSSWHVDKRVPIALMITIGVQTAGIVWWASDISARVGYVERQISVSAPQADRLTRVEVRVESIQEGVNRIERMIQRPPPQ